MGAVHDDRPAPGEGGGCPAPVRLARPRGPPGGRPRAPAGGAGGGSAAARRQAGRRGAPVFGRHARRPRRGR
eukprot:6599090-Pyramimonas_sp.AAC.2